MSDDTKDLYNIYGDQFIKLDFNVINVNDTDRNIISTQLIQDPLFWNRFQFKDLPNKLKIFMDKVKEVSSRAKSLCVNITTSEKEDRLIADTNFEYKRFYLSPLVYYYTAKPNAMMVKLNYALMNNRPGSGRIQEDEISVGTQYSQNKRQTSVFLQNTIFFKAYELITKMKSSQGDIDIMRKDSSSSVKLTLSQNFNERPFLFRENSLFDHVNRLNFQLSHKVINNYPDEAKCSPEMLANLPSEDSQLKVKMGYQYNTLDITKFTGMNFTMGCSLIKTLNSFYAQNKVFLRKLFSNRFFAYQFNFELGTVTNLFKKPSDELKVHEKLFIHHFRGIVSPSRKVIVDQGKGYMSILILLAKTGDSLGNTNYLLLSNKILFPLSDFNLSRDGLQIAPFLHLNCLVNPQTILEGKISDKSYNPLHISAGFGLSFLTKACAIELNYNAYVKKNLHDVGSEFSLKLGID